MTGLEPGSSGIGSNRTVNCATTTALKILIITFFEDKIEVLTTKIFL